MKIYYGTCDGHGWHRHCHLSIHNKKGEIANRPMSNNGDVTYDGTSYFTYEQARAGADFERNPKLALGFASEKGLFPMASTWPSKDLPSSSGTKRRFASTGRKIFSLIAAPTRRVSSLSSSRRRAPLEGARRGIDGSLMFSPMGVATMRGSHVLVIFSND